MIQRETKTVMALRKTGVDLLADIHTLLALLAESKREHEHCDDCWYCCRACRHSDHGLYEGEHLGEGDDTLSIGASFKPGDCTCGATEWNAKVDAATDWQNRFEARQKADARS